jgi:hypothetical protein
MTSDKDNFEERARKFAAHLKMDSLGRVSLRTRDKAIREAWAAADDKIRVGAQLLATLRFTEELQHRAAALSMSEQIADS